MSGAKMPDKNLLCDWGYYDGKAEEKFGFFGGYLFARRDEAILVFYAHTDPFGNRCWLRHWSMPDSAKQPYLHFQAGELPDWVPPLLMNLTWLDKPPTWEALKNAV